MIHLPLVYSCISYIIPKSKGGISKLQQFHSECTRIITQGYYHSENTQVRNDIIWRKYHIPTIGSKLWYIRLKTYFKWKRYDTVNYLNDKEYIGQELSTLGSYIISDRNDLKNYTMTTNITQNSNISIP